MRKSIENRGIDVSYFYQMSTSSSHIKYYKLTNEMMALIINIDFTFS